MYGDALLYGDAQDSCTLNVVSSLFLVLVSAETNRARFLKWKVIDYYVHGLHGLHGVRTHGSLPGTRILLSWICDGIRYGGDAVGLG